jgi:hypothetical protein
VLSVCPSGFLLAVQISKEEETKVDIQKKMHKLSEQLHKLNESLAAKAQARQDYDVTISETEAAYAKIVWTIATAQH